MTVGCCQSREESPIEILCSVFNGTRVSRNTWKEVNINPQFFPITLVVCRSYQGWSCPKKSLPGLN
jgi:hypothetical protein